jgi:hypothetical protein
VRDDAGDETVGERLGRIESAAGEEHVPRQRDADLLREDRGVIGVGDAPAQLRSGEPALAATGTR